LHEDQREVGARGHGYADTNVAVVQQHAERRLAGREGRCVCIRSRRRVRAVVDPEDRIETLRGVEDALNLSDRDTHRGLELVARVAGASVRSQVLKEGVLPINGDETASRARSDDLDRARISELVDGQGRRRAQGFLARAHVLFGGR